MSSYAAGIVTASVKETQQKKAPKGDANEDAAYTEYYLCCQHPLYIISCRKWSDFEPVVSCGDGEEKWQPLTEKAAGQAAPAEALECPGSGSCTNALMQKKGVVLQLPSPPKLNSLSPHQAHPNKEYCFKGCSRHKSSQMSAAC